MVEIRLRDVPEMLVVTEQHTVDQAALEAWLPGAMARVAKLASAHAGPLGTADWPYLGRPASPAEPVLLVSYGGNPNEGPIPVEVLASVPAGHADHADPVGADVAMRRVPPLREAYARVTKELVASGGLGAVYGAIEAWIAAQGLRIAGPPRETYWTDFFQASPTDAVFDVSFPVAAP